MEKYVGKSYSVIGFGLGKIFKLMLNLFRPDIEITETFCIRLRLLLHELFCIEIRIWFFLAP
jgi:hypothetical protein